MERKKSTFRELVSLSIVVSVFFAFSQATGFIARLVLRLQLGSETYGVFAFFLSIFQFVVVLNGFSLHVPIIALISRNLSDESLYNYTGKQVLTTSLITGTILSIVFIVWTTLVTGELIIAILFGIMIVVYTSSQIIHCLPRGRNRLRPASLSLVIVGLIRLGLLGFFVLLGTDLLLSAVIVYIIPYLGWWISYFYHEGFPKLEKPRFDFIKRIYKQGAVSYLFPLSLHLPSLLAVIVLQVYFGFESVGDFDIVMIPYSALTAVLSGIGFVTISKARKLPSFGQVIGKLVKRLIVPLAILAAIVALVGFVFEDTAIILIEGFGFPGRIYRPALVLIILGIPTMITVSILANYFQGRGVIKPVGMISVGCFLVMMPLLIWLGMSFSVLGIAIAIGIVNISFIIGLIYIGSRSNVLDETAEVTLS